MIVEEQPQGTAQKLITNVKVLIAAAYIVWLCGTRLSIFLIKIDIGRYDPS